MSFRPDLEIGRRTALETGNVVVRLRVEAPFRKSIRPHGHAPGRGRDLKIVSSVLDRTGLGTNGADRVLVGDLELPIGRLDRPAFAIPSEPADLGAPFEAVSVSAEEALDVASPCTASAPARDR